MGRRAIVIAIMFAGAAAACGDNAPVYADRAEALVARMTLDEKLAQLHGVTTAAATRTVPGLERLDIPRFNASSGPAGACCGGPGHEGPATAMPAPIALAATWDVELARQYGAIVGGEAAAWGNTLLAGPDIGIARVPQHGRTFEGYGEDPFLVGEIATGFVIGAQTQGVIATATHVAADTQETDRGTVSAEIDERTLRELYLPALEATVTRGHVGAVSCASSKLGGTYTCEHDRLLNQILKGEWAFDGFVTSDAAAVHDTEASALGGLDLELPTGDFFGPALADAVRAGRIDPAVLDDKLARRFRTTMRLDAWHEPRVGSIPLADHDQAATAFAAAGTVLLKNEWSELPLSPDSLFLVAVIGPHAAEALTGGGGSSHVTPAIVTTPAEGLQARLAGQAQVIVNDGADLPTATQLASNASIAIVIVGDQRTEGADGELALPPGEDALVSAIALANTRTIVVVRSGGPVLMPWLGQVHTVLETWYPGQTDGAALAAVLFGDLEPGGRLPITFPRAAADVPAATAAQYPGVDGVAHYSEGVFVGYRHYDASNVAPLFPFGFGLSYTSFGYRGLTLSASEVSVDDPSVTVSVLIANTGFRTGSEVVQVYVGIPDADGAPQPPRWLRGFAKVKLDGGDTAEVAIHLDARAFAHWDTARHAWVVSPGRYPISVGASSRDLRLFATLRIR
ncbi:MAG: glycoside hydrolase family 3 C-terminal domain-containing protein [Deltaproteobacteria bacterium]|nr:glycoside hydrolase family 3 C-terminal domain-containing protein [Deltaproteobacteria bacterium]